MKSIIGALAVLTLLLTPSVACAETQLISHESETVTGLELATNAATGLTDVEIGSSEATFTLSVDGDQTSFAIGYADALMGGEEGPAGGLASISLLGVVGGALFKVVRFLMRLGA